MKDIITVYHRRCIFEKKSRPNRRAESPSYWSAAKAPKTAMKDLWLKTKRKIRFGTEGNTLCQPAGGILQCLANTAADQMLSGTKSTVKKGADLTYRGGKKLAQTTAKKAREKREVSVF